MLAENVGQVVPVDALRITVISLLVVLISLVILKRTIGSWEKAALICSGGVLLFFSYGHVYTVLKYRKLGSFVVARHLYLFPLWILLMLFWAWIILKKIRRFTYLSRCANLVSVGTFVFPLFFLATYALQSNIDLESLGFQYIDVEQAQLSSDIEFPDIYYIILDGYAREDVLMELYNYDNSDFLLFLENEGFYVAEESRSNYNQTHLSLSSSLNLTYLDFIPESLGSDAINRLPLVKLIEENQVINFLRSFGYKAIAFNSGYVPTVINSTDIFWDSLSDDELVLGDYRAGSTFNAFENLLLRSSAMNLLMDFSIIEKDQGINPSEDPLYTSHRQRILYIFSKLKEVPFMEGSNFVFAHIIAPHPPFVFGSRGQWITPPGSYTLTREGKFFTGPPEEYIKGYRDQLSHINTILIETVSSILDHSDSSPVIILQADHGPGAYLDQDSIENSNLKERISILNGYYFPDQDTSGLYPSISPVNTFRIVFNRIFHTEFELLEDTSYFSTLRQPFDFYLVPEDLN
jgi:hypothetical protein